jgi:hypothetical protein
MNSLLQARIFIPVGTSSLIQIPLEQSVIGNNKGLGIITFDADYVVDAHLKAVGINYNVPIVGVKKGGIF